MEALSPHQKSTQAIANFCCFWAKTRTTVPNLVPKAEKGRDAALCKDNKNTAMQVKVNVQILAQQLTVGETETDTMY